MSLSIDDDLGANVLNQITEHFGIVGRSGEAFYCRAQSTPDMTVQIYAGGIQKNVTLTEKASQNTSSIPKPTTNPRIDRVVIDDAGVASVVTGTEAASPSAPAVPYNKIAIAQISLTTSHTEIVQSDITDERPAFYITPLRELLVEDQKAAATNGGNSSAGANTRTLNTVVYNDIAGASLGSNQITLPAGTYRAEFGAPAFGTAINHATYLYDTTGAATLVYGRSGYTAGPTTVKSQTDSNGAGQVTLSATSAIELRHQISAAVTNGLGNAVWSSGDTEVYGWVKITQIS